MSLQAKKQNDLSNGKRWEDVFGERAVKAGYTWVKSSKEVDMRLHIDGFLDGYGVDVKASKSKFNMWLDYTNVRGYAGWLRGSAQYIAMRVAEDDFFAIFNRTDLLAFFLKERKGIATTNKEYLKVYTREGNSDKIMRVSYDHIKHLQKGKL